MRHLIRPLGAESIAGDGGGEDAVGSNELGGQEGQEALNADGDEQAPDMDHENAEGEQGHVVEEPAPEDPAYRPRVTQGSPQNENADSMSSRTCRSGHGVRTAWRERPPTTRTDDTDHEQTTRD